MKIHKNGNQVASSPKIWQCFLALASQGQDTGESEVYRCLPVIRRRISGSMNLTNLL